MAAVITVNVWRGLPFFAITVLAGLVVDPARVLRGGRGRRRLARSRRFRHVTLPLLKPVLAVVILFSTIFTFNDFNIVYVLTRGGPVNTTHLFATLAYQVGLQGGNLGQGAAISLFMLPLLAAGGLLPAPLHQERVTMITGVRSRGARLRSTAFGYANLVPFVVLRAVSRSTSCSSRRSNRTPSSTASSRCRCWIQNGVIVDHYRYLFGRTEFLTWIKNSLIISVAATTHLAGDLRSWPATAWPACASAASARSAPPCSSPTWSRPRCCSCRSSQVVVWLGISDTIWALIVTYPTFLVPFSTWLLMGYFRTDPPRDRGVRARRRGQPDADARCASRCRWPSPASCASILFGFTLTWNEFIYALTFVSQTRQQDRRSSG